MDDFTCRYEVNKLPAHMSDLAFETEELAAVDDAASARAMSSR